MVRIRTLAAGVFVAAAVVLGSAVPATAHDELIGSNPEVGSTLTETPTEVELSFSGRLMADGAEINVVDAAGENWSDGAVQIVEMTATQAVKPGMLNGAYEVQWRVVSSDGHPIAGEIPFTVDSGVDAPVESAAPDATEEVTAEPAETAAPPVIAESPTAEPVGQEESGWSALTIIAIIAVLVLAGAIGTRVYRSSKATPGRARGGAGGAGGAGGGAPGADGA